LNPEDFEFLGPELQTSIILGDITEVVPPPVKVHARTLVPAPVKDPASEEGGGADVGFDPPFSESVPVTSQGAMQDLEETEEGKCRKSEGQGLPPGHLAESGASEMPDPGASGEGHVDRNTDHAAADKRPEMSDLGAFTGSTVAKPPFPVAEVSVPSEPLNESSDSAFSALEGTVSPGAASRTSAMVPAASALAGVAPPSPAPAAAPSGPAPAAAPSGPVPDVAPGAAQNADPSGETEWPLSELMEILDRHLSDRHEAREGMLRCADMMFRTMGPGAELVPPVIDEIIGGLDELMSSQLDEVLHHPDFSRLERAWLSLQYLVERVDFQENIQIQLLNVTKEELYYDLTDSPEIVRSSLYRLAYTEEYGQYGGKPYAVLLGAYEFASMPEDYAILSHISAIGTMAHAPFIADAAIGFFGLRNWSELSGIADLSSILDDPRYAPFQDLRSRENSRALALVLPGFLARLPYTPFSRSIGSFNYTEHVTDADRDYAWGYSAFLLVTRMAGSFARYRWYTDFTGVDGGGLVDDLPCLEFESMGDVQARISTQALIGEKLENQLSSYGFLPLTALGSTGKASFNSAQSVLRTIPPRVGGNPQENMNQRISTMLPYMMVIYRLAHYIKVLQRENIGTWKDSNTLQREINQWIGQFVTDMDSPSPSIRAKRPLRSARVEVSDLPDSPGWHQMIIHVRPHLKFMGASFSLTLMGRLEDADVKVKV
jgi:type VI secretion system protein ImpC